MFNMLIKTGTKITIIFCKNRILFKHVRHYEERSNPAFLFFRIASALHTSQ